MKSVSWQMHGSLRFMSLRETKVVWQETQQNSNNISREFNRDADAFGEEIRTAAIIQLFKTSFSVHYFKCSNTVKPENTAKLEKNRVQFGVLLKDPTVACW